MKRSFTWGGLAVGVLASASQATPTINVGNHVLAPDLPGQPVQISVSGGDPVQGLDLNAEIADGGPNAGGTILGPAFTAADLVTGTLFAPNNTGQQNLTSFSNSPQIYAGAIVTNSGSVPASGLLATLTVSTTTFSTPGASFALRLKGFSNNGVSGDTDFAGLPADITNGNLIIGYPGDLNLDGSVGFSDLLTMAQNYGHTGATYAQGDINHDGTVNFADLLTLAQNYGKSVNTNIVPPAVVPAFSAVPEPGLGLVAIGLGLLCRRSRRVK